MMFRGYGAVLAPMNPDGPDDEDGDTFEPQMLEMSNPFALMKPGDYTGGMIDLSPPKPGTSTGSTVGTYKCSSGAQVQAVSKEDAKAKCAAAKGGSSTTTYIIIGVAVLAAIFLLKK